MNPYMFLGALIGAAGLFGFGVRVGSEFQAGKCDGKMINELRIANGVVTKKQNEIEQCRAQVNEINATVAEQGKRLSRMLQADAKAREAAQVDARQRDVELAQAQQRVREALLNLKDTIDETDFGECAGTTVPDDLNKLLNEFISADGDGRP